MKSWEERNFSQLTPEDERKGQIERMRSKRLVATGEEGAEESKGGAKNFQLQEEPRERERER